jgi:hypothetical protein
MREEVEPLARARRVADTSIQDCQIRNAIGEQHNRLYAAPAV